MIEAARTSETSVNFYQTSRRYNPEDSHLHTHCRENLKSYLIRNTTASRLGFILNEFQQTHMFVQTLDAKNSELELRHRKRGRECGKGNGNKTERVCQSV
jgi:hypothetical protein